MSSVCPGITRKGTRCTQSLRPGETWCYNHDPARASARKRASAKAGKAKGQHLTKNLHELLEDLTARVVDDDLDTSKGAVAAQLINTRIRLMAHELKVKEIEEIEVRLCEVEERLELQAQDGRRWG